MVSTAETSDADVPVPVKSRMGGVTPEFNATSVLAGAPSVEPGVPQALKPTKMRAVDAKINIRQVFVAGGRRYEFITRLLLEQMTASRFLSALAEQCFRVESDSNWNNLLLFRH